MDQDIRLLRDDQWRQLAPLLHRDDEVAHVGRRPLDDRAVFEALLWVVRQAARWQDLPDHYPSARTCQRRVRQWRSDSRFDNAWRKYIHSLDETQRQVWQARFARRPMLSSGKGGRAGRPPWWLSLADEFNKAMADRTTETNPFAAPTNRGGGGFGSATG